MSGRISFQPSMTVSTLNFAGTPRAKRAAEDVARQGLAIEIAFAKDYDDRFTRTRNAMTLAMVALLPLLAQYGMRNL